MTDRVKALTVVLDKDIRIDDVEPLMRAICTHRGVLKVVPVVAEPSETIAQMRANDKLRTKLYALIDELKL